MKLGHRTQEAEKTVERYELGTLKNELFLSPLEK